MQKKEKLEAEIAKIQKKLDSSADFDKNKILELKQQENDLSRELKQLQDVNYLL